MRMIILRSWPDDRTLVVVVVLVAQVPIETAIDSNCQPAFRRLVTHRIRVDQDAGIPGRISDAIALSIVLVDSVRRVQRHATIKPGRCVKEEEVVPHEVQAVTQRMSDAGGGSHLIEIIDHRVAMDQVVIETRANCQLRINLPIDRGSEYTRPDVDTEIRKRYAGNFRRI